MKTTLFSILALATCSLLAASGPSAAPAEDAKPPRSATPPKAQKITTFLWFDDDAEEAVRFYTSVFPDSKVLSETRWGEGGPVPEGTLMVARFQLAGQQFLALNGGPKFKFTEAISLYVSCETQAEIDALWDKLGAGGEAQACGWIRDKYGLSWQLIPSALEKLMASKDPARARRVAEAMLQMKKLDIEKLQRAHDGP